MDWFYDNLNSTVDGEPDVIQVERIYCLDFDVFTDAEWNTLSRIYDQLPQRQTNPHDGCPWWFGVDEESGDYLWASVEPPGLQVAGILKPDDWRKWDSLFLSLADSLPKRDMT